MKLAVRYYTRSGNTKKLAEAVGGVAGVPAEELSSPLTEQVDLLFLGSSPYAFDVDPAVKDFLRKNGEKIGTLVCFGTSASGMSTFKKIRALAEKQGITVLEEHFNCHGRFLKLHQDRPNQEDLNAVATFAKGILENKQGRA